MQEHDRERPQELMMSSSPFMDFAQALAPTHKWLACGQGKEDVRSNIKS
jgi:hypothetical protein